MEPMYRPQDDVGSIKAGFTRNYSPREMDALKQFIGSHRGSPQDLLGSLSRAGVPLRDVALLTGGVRNNDDLQTVMPKAPNAGVDMGGGYGGVAPTAYGSAPFRGSNSGLAALAGQLERTPRMPIDDPIERIPRVPPDYRTEPRPYMPRDYMIDDPSAGYPNLGSSIAQMQRDLYPGQPPAGYTNDYPPQQPISYGGDGYPPRQPISYGGDGGYNGPGGMFPSYPPEYQQPIGDRIEPMPYRNHPYDPGYDVDPMMPPKMYEDYARPMPSDPLGTLMGQVAESRIPNERMPIGEAMKRGGAVDISQHPTLVRMALGNRR